MNKTIKILFGTNIVTNGLLILRLNDYDTCYHETFDTMLYQFVYFICVAMIWNYENLTTIIAGIFIHIIFIIVLSLNIYFNIDKLYKCTDGYYLFFILNLSLQYFYSLLYLLEIISIIKKRRNEHITVEQADV